MIKDVGAETLAACFLAVYASHPPVARREATLATGLPATALTGLDFHQLDFFEWFHRLISDPPLPHFSQRDSLDIDHELELGWLRKWQVGCLAAPQNLIH